MSTAQKSLRANAAREGRVLVEVESGHKMRIVSTPPTPGGPCDMVAGTLGASYHYSSRNPPVTPCTDKTAYRTRRSIIGSDLTRLSLAQGASKHTLSAELARKGPYQDY